MTKRLYLKSGEHLAGIHFPTRHQAYSFDFLPKQTDVRFDGLDWFLGERKLPVGASSFTVADQSVEAIVFHEEPSIFDIKGRDFLVIGAEEAADIQLEGMPTMLLHQETGKVKLTVEEPVFVNQQLVTGPIFLAEGDEWFVEGTIFRYQSDELTVWTQKEPITSLLCLPSQPVEAGETDFHRSPRIIYREPTQKITIAKPPNAVNKNNQSLMRMIIPPIVMLVLLSVVYLIRPMGIYIIMMVGMSMVTMILSVTAYFGKKKEWKSEEEARKEQYERYLEKKAIELHELTKEQIHALHYHYPSLEEMMEMVTKKDRRLYEKTSLHHDFLSFRLGLGEQEPSFPIEYSEADFIQNRDELYDHAQQVKDTYSKVKDMPIVADLKQGPLAFIGRRDLVRNQLHFLFMQISSFHSYHEVQFIVSFREEELAEWEWMRWLPHSQIRSLNVRGFIYHQRSRDQILTSLYQIIKERKLFTEQNKNQNQETLFAPHYVFVMSEMELVMDHVIMEYIEEDLTKYGVSLVFVEEVMEGLPEHVKTIIDIRNPHQGSIVIQAGELLNQTFQPQALIEDAQKERFSRQLAAIHHVQNLGNAIPETITFLELYRVESVKELAIRDRWRTNEAYRTLAVPVGARGKDDEVFLNLHEKAHGPHGLIAGTTGSGKSELIQSYILSLAVNFHPYEVAFLLIDYKGGGMANLFKNLPHLVGTITNLDGAQAMRALVSIKAELQKRQRLFNEQEVNHINQYHKLYKEGQVTIPMPHLFIISDEFAELKAEQPDFMKELVSTARIGRSLGIHLVLATQKPSGVVDDQIWSNSKFKIALKVQNAADSNEVLKTPDAAQITQTGRAYLQVGNNEIYELFQSAWSGAPYSAQTVGTAEVDQTIYLINEKGQYEIISKDLSGLDQQAETKTTMTELEAVIEEVEQEFDGLGLEKVAQPWLPPLPDRLAVQSYQEGSFKDAWQEKWSAFEVMIGMQDLPTIQAQEPLIFDLERSGHFLVASSPGYGKSTFVQSFSLDLMRKHSPEQVEFYLFDFGNNGLLPLLDFPHVADHFALDETEKIQKALRRLQEEIRRRKQALSNYKIGTIAQYNQLVEEPISRIIVAIDGYDAVRDSAFQEEFESLMNQLARDGASHGITLIITTNRVSSVRMNIQANLKTKIGLYLFDRMELNGLLGRSGHMAEEIPGRAMTKMEEVVTFQVFTPFDTTNVLETVQAIKAEAAAMNEAWLGRRPARIPMMPDEVLPVHIAEQVKPTDWIQAGNFIVGLDQEEVEVASLDFTASMILASDKPAEIERYQQLVAYNLKHAASDSSVIVLDANREISVLQQPDVLYYQEPSDLQMGKQQIMNDIKNRLQVQADVNKPKYLIIPDLARFADAANLTEEEMRFILVEGARVGVVTILIGNSADLLSGYGRPAKVARTIITQALIGLRITDQEFERFPYIPREPYLKIREAYIIHNQNYQKVQLLAVQ